MKEFSALSTLLFSAIALAQPGASALAQAPGRVVGSSFVEAGAFYQPVTEGFGDWKGGYARAVVTSQKNAWYLEAKSQEAFRDRGSYGSISNVHTLSDRVYSQLGIGGGTGGYVLPDLRVDGALSLKLGHSKAVVVTVGATLVAAKQDFSDKAAFGTLTWYVGPGVVAEIGARFNSSNPGGVGSGRGTVALTLGRVGRHLVVLRGGAGTEGYQLTGGAAALRRFKSQEAGVSWRQWIARRWGLVFGADWYHNPFYTRAGLTIGGFRAW
jgi:YaiO family outer membrane protein